VSPPHSRWKKHATGPGALIASTALVGALTVGLIGPDVVKEQLELSFVRQPTPYTELYFARPEALPTAVALKAGSQFVFEIHNLEGDAMAYEYVTTRRTVAGVKSFGRGSLEVAAGRRAQKLVRVPPNTAPGPFVVSVALVGRPESIDFVGRVTK
jgi:hypothetical protein